MEMRNRQITIAHLFEIPLCQLILIGLGKMIQLSDNLLLQLICYIIALHSSLHPTHNGTKAHTKHAAIQFYKPIFFASYYMNINFCCPKQGFQLTVAGLPPSTTLHSLQLLARCQSSIFMHTAALTIPLSPIAVL